MKAPAVSPAPVLRFIQLAFKAFADVEDMGNAGLGRFLFEPNIPATHIAIARHITQSLMRWEPRIRVAQVEVDADPSDPQAALATITYRLVSTAQQATLNIGIPVAS